MKKVFCFMFLLALLIVWTSSASAMLNYLDEYNDFVRILDEESYDDFIQAVQQYHIDHPKIMTDEWTDSLISITEQAKIAFMPEVNSEYDAFDNVTYFWFGTHRKANAEENCVLMDAGKGYAFYFYFPVDKIIRVKEYAALINGDTRITGKVENPFFSSDNASLYESFFIKLSALSDSGIEQVESIAFRFYGANRDKYFDYSVDDEVINYFSQLTAKAIGKDDIKSLLRNWVETVDSIVDDSIIPTYVKRIMRRNEGRVFPENLCTADYYSFQQDLRDDVLKLSSLGMINIGKTYVFPCLIKAIHEPNYWNARSYWEVEIRGPEGFRRSNGYIIFDHAIEKEGWLVNAPQSDETIIVAATFAGSQSGFYGPVFFLGYDTDTIEAAKQFGK